MEKNDSIFSKKLLQLVRKQKIQEGKHDRREKESLLRKFIASFLHNGTMKLTMFIVITTGGIVWHELVYNPYVKFEVSGFVYDYHLEDAPLKNIPVYFSNYSEHTITDTNGRFSTVLKIRKRDASLVISCGGTKNYPVLSKEIDVPPNNPKLFETVFHLHHLDNYTQY